MKIPEKYKLKTILKVFWISLNTPFYTPIGLIGIILWLSFDLKEEFYHTKLSFFIANLFCLLIFIWTIIRPDEYFKKEE